MLTLSGFGTPGQYDTALRSVTFSTTSTSLAPRSISIIADDSLALPMASNTVAESVNVAIAAPAVTTSGFQTLFSFGGTNGENPFGSLTLGGANLYGMTESGGANGYGTVFSAPATGGTPTTLLSFNGGSGDFPVAV